MKNAILLLTLIGPRQVDNLFISFKYISFFVLIPACSYGTSHNAANENAHVKFLLKHPSGILDLVNHFEQTLS